MSSTTDWLSATGGIVGAIGGPAGMWAAWNQHRMNRRRRFGPPEELVGLLGKILDVAHDVTLSYRDEAWLEASGLRPASERVDELSHLVTDGVLRHGLRLVTGNAGLVLGATTDEDQSPERSVTTVTNQARYAAELDKWAKDTLGDLRRQL
ncbi:hypothetical protein ABZ454_06310 [Streptomyces sp. NPDC005803]|uniref:hypothetical protein n=1 Tax=Streptomyces sp. NPDC005803 TaxID=3154297 RepID=UPI0033E2DE1F